MTAQKLVALTELADVAWNRLSHAANDTNDPLRLVTLANIDPDGLPQARIMVIRGADREASRIWFHTDSRSRKIEQLQRNGNVCVVAWDVNDRIQLRLYGTITIHENDDVANDHWQQTTTSVRHVYGNGPVPKQPLPAADPRLQRLWRHQERTRHLHQPLNFVVLEMHVTRIEWQQVLGAAQRCATLSRESNWALQPSATS